MVSEKNISFIQNFNKNGIAIVSEDFKDSVFCINRKYEKISDDYDYIKPAGQNLYVFPDEFGSEAYYSFKRGKFIKESRIFSGYLGEFNNDIALVLDDDGLVSSGTVSYYIDRKFRIVSPFYSYVEEFDGNGIARVIDLCGNYHYVNNKFERISPLFTEVSLPDEKGIIVTSEETMRGVVDSYYQLINGQFERISKLFNKAYSFSGDLAIVQDYETNKWYLIDENFEKISREYDSMTNFINVPDVIKAEVKGRKVYLTTVTGSKVTNPNLYNEVVKTVERVGYDNLLNELEELELFKDAKKTDWSDLKVAVKDYFIKNIEKIGYSNRTEDLYIEPTRKRSMRTPTTKAVKDWIEKESSLFADTLKEQLSVQDVREDDM